MPQGVLDLNAALAPGVAGANDIDTIITQALNYWNNLVPSADVDSFDDTKAQAAAAIAMLQAFQTHIHDPTQGYLPT